MARSPDVRPTPFFLPGGSTGVLLIHGFTGSPAEMRLVGDYLNKRELTISAPLLPGHGTTVEAMNRCRWQNWTDHAQQAYEELTSLCETVFVGGLSMGALITIYLAAHHQPGGAILYSPALQVTSPLIHLAPLFKHVVHKVAKSGQSDMADPAADRRAWSYAAYPTSAAHELLKLIGRCKELLPRVTCPLLAFYSTGDSMIKAEGAQRVVEDAGSEDAKLVTLHNSGHVLTVDSEWMTVAERTYDFIRSQTEEEA